MVTKIIYYRICVWTSVAQYSGGYDHSRLATSRGLKSRDLTNDKELFFLIGGTTLYFIRITTQITPTFSSQK